MLIFYSFNKTIFSQNDFLKKTEFLSINGNEKLGSIVRNYSNFFGINADYDSLKIPIIFFVISKQTQTLESYIVTPAVN